MNLITGKMQMVILHNPFKCKILIMSYIQYAHILCYETNKNSMCSLLYNRTQYDADIWVGRTSYLWTSNNNRLSYCLPSYAKTNSLFLRCIECIDHSLSVCAFDLKFTTLPCRTIHSCSHDKFDIYVHLVHLITIETRDWYGVTKWEPNRS